MFIVSILKLSTDTVQKSSDYVISLSVLLLLSKEGEYDDRVDNTYDAC